MGVKHPGLWQRMTSLICRGRAQVCRTLSGAADPDVSTAEL